MKRFIVPLWKMVLITATGTLGSITLGLLLHGSGVFDPAGVSFAFVAFGLTGSFIFAFYHVYGLSNSVTAAVSTGVVQFIIASNWMPMLNAGVWSFGVNLPAVWLAFLFERKLASLRWARFMAVGAVYGTVFVLLTLIVGLAHDYAAIPSAVFQENFVDGLLIGLGMGSGVQLGEANIDSLRPAG